jgi:putative transposase
LYLELGSTPQERQQAYRKIFEKLINDKKFLEVRTTVSGGIVLGEDWFKDEVERIALQRVLAGKRGRPR